MTTAKAIETEALSLPREDRAKLVMQLLESIEDRPEVDPRQVEQVWLREANRRYEAYRRGEEQAIPAEDVFSELQMDDR